ncbi:hypothetical protein OF83DRAFT_674304 [Amylostereum chailletii]|nr:hypothetical protein OF83DRAFT_674304 [Amylostereum chailletii]
MPPPRKPDSAHKLVFTTNSLRNTTISVHDDTIYYEVVTRFWHPHITKILKLDKEARQMDLVAEIERVPGKEVRVRVGGEHGSWVSQDEVLRWDADARGGSWTATEGTEYRWKSHNRRLQLVRTDDVQKVPVAKFHPHRRYFFVLRMSTHACLEVKTEAASAMDQLILSYLLVEKRRRDRRLRVRIETS